MQAGGIIREQVFSLTYKQTNNKHKMKQADEPSETMA